MNEEYLKTLYNHIGGSEKGIDYDSFKIDMSTNKEYNTTIYNHIGGKKAGIDYNSFISDTGLKKKDQSKLSSQEKLWGSNSKPKDVYTTLVTEAPKRAGVSVSLNGKSKVKTQAPSKEKLVPINEDTENDDDFWSYLDNSLTSTLMSAVKSIADTPEMLYDFAVQASPTPAGAIMREISDKTKLSPSKILMKDLGISNVPSKHLKSGLDILNKKIDKKEKEYGGDPISAIENGQYSNAAKLIAGTTVKSSPMMAIAIGTGGSTAGLAAIGTLTASQKYQENVDNKKMSQEAKLGSAAVSGIIETTLGHLFTGASGAVAKRILKDQGVQAGSKLIGNSLRTVLEKNIAKTPLVGLVGEVAEESGVEFGNQANDILFGIRDDFDFKAIGNAGLSATGMGGVNTVSVYGAKGYMSLKNYNKIKETNKAIARLQSEMNKDGISEESKKIFQIKHDELVSENKQFAGQEIEKIKLLSKEDKSLLVQSNKVIEEVQSSIDNIKDDSTLDPEAKKIAIQEIYKDYVEAHGKKKEILSKIKDMDVSGDFSNFNGVPLDFDLENSGIHLLPIEKQNQLNKQAFDILNNELNPTGEEKIDITKEMVHNKAVELLNIENEQQPLEAEEPSKTDLLVESTRRNAKKETVSKEKSISDDYVSLSEQIKNKENQLNELNDKIVSSESESKTNRLNNKKLKIEEELNGLVLNRKEIISSDEKMDYIHNNIDKIIKELTKKGVGNPCK